MGTCYWNHDVKPDDTYICLDGTNQVCPRCCVEKCAVETPPWFAKCAEAGHPTWPSVKESKTVAAKLVCLESYWNRDLFKNDIRQWLFRIPRHLDTTAAPARASLRRIGAWPRLLHALSRGLTLASAR